MIASRWKQYAMFFCLELIMTFFLLNQWNFEDWSNPFAQYADNVT